MKKVIFFLVVFVFISCSKETNNVNRTDYFNRKEMLTFWADKMIIPTYKFFSEKTKSMDKAIKSFVKNPNQENLLSARDTWRKAYIAWQKVSLYNIGKSASISMVKKMNTFPTIVGNIDKYISKQNYDFESPNLYSVQGFPAIDYLLYGKGTDSQTIDFYLKPENEKYGKYLIHLSNQINILINKVLNEWSKSSYRNEFVNNTELGSEAGSTDKMLNYFVIPFYEKQFRTNKLETPLGIKNNAETIPTSFEAYYAKDLSKELYLTALHTAIDFFQGTAFDGSKGVSLQQYLKYLKRDDLIEDINKKFNEILEKSNSLDNNFVKQMSEDRKKMVLVYEKIQNLLKRFKPDLMSALSVKNTSTDTDND